MKYILSILLLASSISYGQQVIGTADNTNKIPGTLQVTGTAGSSLGGGTTAQRAGSYSSLTRWNSDSGRYEVFTGSAWRGLAYNGEAATGTGGTGGSSYTFSTGLTNTAGTVTSNISTGVVGGQFIYGGKNAGEGLVIYSNSSTTKGQIRLGDFSTYDEGNKRIGIGTTTPSAVIHAISTDASIVLQGTSSTAYSGMHLYNESNTLTASVQAGNSAINGFAKNSLILGSRLSGGSIVFFRGGIGSETENARFDSTGKLVLTGDMQANSKVGIGTTTTPLNKLHVFTTTSADGISLDGNNNPAIVLRSSGVVKGYAPAIATGANGFFSGTAAGDFVFRNEANKIHFGSVGGAVPPALTIGNGILGVNNVSPASSAVLDIVSTTKGVLFPRMTTTQRTAITLDATNDGLMVYDVTAHKLFLNENGTWVQK